MVVGQQLGQQLHLLLGVGRGTSAQPPLLTPGQGVEDGELGQDLLHLHPAPGGDHIAVREDGVEAQVTPALHHVVVTDLEAPD